RIIQASTDEGDIVLDFMMGSGTTQAVAHKMNRQFIGIEQMDYINTVSVPRLQKVIEGEQSGISKDVSWEGGGSFVYAELYELNQVYIDKIQTATDQDSIQDVLESIQTSDFLNLKVDLDKIFNKNDEFFELSLDEQKAILIQALDNNQLYLSYSEIDDDQYEINENTKAFNASFYDEEV
ncbi:MAG: site-specific DNA-methyltransferase, partial [Tetragenococcus halophilus]|nr:site-specific DNA-methyltransferase [Tetragenococcus halophilus]